jgi:hypothetical protein
LKAVVARELLACAPDKGEGVLKRLSGCPRHPVREMLAVGIDERVQLLRICLLEQTQPTPVIQLDSQSASCL